jgi:hypothetical protein
MVKIKNDSYILACRLLPLLIGVNSAHVTPLYIHVLESQWFFFFNFINKMKDLLPEIQLMSEWELVLLIAVLELNEANLKTKK